MEYLIVWCVLGFVGALILNSSGRAGIGCLLGVLLGPLGWLVALCLRNPVKKGERDSGSRDVKNQTARTTIDRRAAVDMRPRVECAYCAEIILAVAKMCKHCGVDLPE